MYDYCLSRNEIKDAKKYQKDFDVIKSFDNRSAIINENGVPTLLSYWTKVARLEDGKLVRLWNDWSATTAKHTTSFCAYYKITPPSKKEWLKMPVR